MFHYKINKIERQRENTPKLLYFTSNKKVRKFRLHCWHLAEKCCAGRILCVDILNSEGAEFQLRIIFPICLGESRYANHPSKND